MDSELTRLAASPKDRSSDTARPTWQSVLGIDAAHSCNREGSIPSAATSRVQPKKPYTQKWSVRVRRTPLYGVLPRVRRFSFQGKDESQFVASPLGRGKFPCSTGTRRSPRDGSTPSTALLELNRRSPTRNKTSWFDSNIPDFTRDRPSVRHFPVKEMAQAFRGFHTRARNFIAVSERGDA